MNGSTLIGKAELLGWAADVTKISPCEKYGDLKDGLIFLALARELFPREIDSAIVRLQRRGARDSGKNWLLLTSCLRRHGIPLHLCNRQAVERGHTRHCFNLLVLFYFLLRLARGDQFSVDFAQPVDPQLAAFLQSPDSVFAVDTATAATSEQVSSVAASIAGTSLEIQNGVDGGEEQDPVRNVGGDSRDGHVVTRLSSLPFTAAAVSPYAHRTLRLSRETGAVPPYAAAGLREGGHRTRPENHSPVKGAASFSSTLSWRPLGFDTRNGTPNAVPVHSNSEGGAATLAHPDHFCEWEAPSSQDAAYPTAIVSHGLRDQTTVLSSPTLVSSLSSLVTENRLLREELQYVKAVSQLCITQQRGSEAAAEMRAAAALQDELAKAKLTHLHDLRQLEVVLSASSYSPAPSFYSTSTSSPWPHRGADSNENGTQLAVLLHRVEVAEQTAAQLYEKLNENYQTYDDTLQQLQQVFHSIDIITEAARPAAPSSSAPPHNNNLDVKSTFSAQRSAAAYEKTVSDAMMAQLTHMPAVLRDAFRSQLQALLLTLSTLRMSNERLRAEKDRSEADSGRLLDINEHNVSAGQRGQQHLFSTATTTSLNTQDLTSLCEEARCLCRTSEPALQKICCSLTEAIKTLCDEVQDVRLDAEGWQERCHQLETIAASAEAALQRALAKDTAQREVDFNDDHATTMVHETARNSETAVTTSSRRRDGAERALQEVQRLYDRVAEVIVATFSTPGTADMQRASCQLVSLLEEFMKRNHSSAALESALTEQCETIAQLRREVRQRGETAVHAKVKLAKLEHCRQELERRCAALESQLCSAKEANHNSIEAGGAVKMQSGWSQRGWLGRASSSTPVALTPRTAEPSLASDGEAAPLLPSKSSFSGSKKQLGSLAVKGTISAPRLASSPCVVSPYRPGALRSPSPSTTEDEDDERGRGKHSDEEISMSSSQGNEKVVPYVSDHSSPSQSLPRRLQEPAPAPPTATPQTTAAALSFNTNTIKSASMLTARATASASPSPLLSAAELERRKQEILRKFDVT